MFNALRHAFPNATIIKTQSLKETCEATTSLKRRAGETLFAMSIRHPYDSLVSWMEVIRKEKHAADSHHNAEAPFTLEELKLSLSQYRRQADPVCLWCAYVPHCNTSVLQMPYAKFSVDYEYLFDSLELFTHTTIDESIRRTFNQTFDVVKMHEATRGKAFSVYGKKFPMNHVEGIHGSHVSKYLGQGDWRKILSPQQVKHLRKEECLNRIISVFDLEGSNAQPSSVHVRDCW